MSALNQSKIYSQLSTVLNETDITKYKNANQRNESERAYRERRGHHVKTDGTNKEQLIANIGIHKPIGGHSISVGRLNLTVSCFV